MPPPEFKSDSAELVILSVLADGPQYGYAIAKQVAARSGGAIGLSPGVMYPTLRSMESAGLITSEWEAVKSDRNADEASEGRRRKWYRLSTKGKRRLTKRIEAHRSYFAMIESFLTGRSPSGDATGSSPTKEGV